jgi:hypothetical protein
MRKNRGSGGSRGSGEFLNAEGAKVSQSAQKKSGENKTKKEKNEIQNQIFNGVAFVFLPYISSSLSSLSSFVFLSVFFCVLCVTFAPSAFKNIRFRPKPKKPT